MADPREDRIRIENQLLEQTRCAREAYDRAKREHDRLAALIKDLGPNSPDGTLALKHAVEIGRVALDNYRRALKDFIDLTVRYIEPKK